MQGRARFSCRQEDEIVKIASKPLTLRQRRRQIRQVCGLLVFRNRKLINRLKPALADKIAGIAKLLEKRLCRRQPTWRETVFDFDKHARLATPDRLDGPLQYGLLMTFDVYLDKARLPIVDVVESIHAHFNGMMIGIF